MSEEASADGPGTVAAPQDEPGPDQAAPSRPPAPERRPRRRLRRTKLLVGLAAGVAVLVVINLVVTSSPGPHYASPHDACTLVKASTLATYAPGATIQRLPPSSGPATPGLSICDWATPASNPYDDHVLSLNVTIFSMSSDAQGGFSSGVQLDRQDSLGTTQSVQQVKGLGASATALIHTGPAAVDLYVWSGNAEIETSFADLAPVGPPLSSATMLTADVAMARDVLAGLPR